MIEKLKQQIVNYKPCSGGFAEFNESTDANLINLFFKNIDFCLANNWPDLSFIKQVPNVVESGIFVNSKLIRQNQEKVVILGKSDIELTCSGYSVSRVYVKHESILYLNAADNAYVVVDALDNAQVFVKKSGSAKVVVNLYSRASSIGATKTVQKNRETYDLQVE